MTDKEEIMIDGVDVSECHFAILPKDSCPAKSRPYARETSCIACKEHNTILNYCKNNPNCYFKQLAHKTQIIDEVEEVIKPYQEQIELDAFSLPIAIESILERKTQECEELKEKNKVLQKLVSELEYSVQTGIELNARCCNALEEIEEIVNKKTETSICSECAYNHLPECKDNCMQDALENILDIINKAKGEGNE